MYMQILYLPLNQEIVKKIWIVYYYYFYKKEIKIFFLDSPYFYYFIIFIKLFIVLIFIIFIKLLILKHSIFRICLEIKQNNPLIANDYYPKRPRK